MRNLLTRIACAVLFLSLAIGNAQAWKARGVAGVPWSVTRGVNLTVLAFLNPLNGTAFPNAYSGANLDYLRGTGIDFVRIGFDPTSILNVASGSGSEITQIGYLTAAIDLALAHRFRVLLDCHVSLSDSGWDAATILADYPASTKWTRLKNFTATMGTALSGYDNRLVAYQQFNEMPGTQANFNAKVLDLYSSFRSTNSTMTVVIGGDQYSSVDGLASWTLSGFTGNYLVGVTPYVPQQFTHQGIPDGSFYAGYNRLSFPPSGGEKTTVQNQINAYPICPTSAPNCYNSTADRDNAIQFTNDYFNTPDDDTWVSGRFDVATAFAMRNGLSYNRIIIPEFGSHGDYGVTGGSTASRAAWMTSIRTKAEARKMSWAVWHWDDGYFTLGFPTLDATLGASLGLTP